MVFAHSTIPVPSVVPPPSTLAVIPVAVKASDKPPVGGARRIPVIAHAAPVRLTEEPTVFAIAQSL